MGYNNFSSKYKKIEGELSRFNELEKYIVDRGKNINKFHMVIIIIKLTAKEGNALFWKFLHL